MLVLYRDGKKAGAWTLRLAYQLLRHQLLHPDIVRALRRYQGRPYARRDSREGEVRP